MKKIAFLIALAAFAGLSNAAPYAAWTKYREVIINTTNAGGGANVAGTVSNFPVLVRLSNASEAAGANVLSEALAGGADVRFTDSTGDVALAYEIDAWSATAATVWVRVPSVAGNASTKIRVYWNRSGATTASDGSAVFSSTNGFVGVWHLGNPSGDPAISSRPNSKSPGTNDAAPVGLSGNPVTQGVVGPADTLGGGGKYFNYGTLSASAFTAGGTATLSMWAYTPAALSGWVQFFTMGNTNGTAGNNAMWLGKRGTGTNSLGAQNITDASNVGVVTAADNTVLTGEWQFISFTVNNQNHILYNQGASAGTNAAGPTLASVERVNNYIGWGTWSADATYPGKVDEPRLSNVARSADWNKLDYETQKPGATAVTLGTTQAPVAPKLAYVDKNAVYRLNQAISPNLNVTNGTISGSFAVVPGLPAGLTLNSTTGVVSGTPTAVSTSAQYVVTVTVDAAPVSDTLTIAVTAGTPPGVPTGVAATPGGASATVTWTAPGSSGTSAITAYTVRAVEDTAKTCGWTTGTLSCIVTGLTNGTPYTFVVRATSAVGSSAFSTASAPVTPAAVPSPPLNVVATQGTAGSATVSWSAPASNGGLSVTDYYVTAAPSGLQCYSPPITNPTCNVTGLTAGTAYTFTVVAANAMGNSNPSVASSPLTVGILGGPFALRTMGYSRPFAFTLTAEAMASTEALTMTISDVYGRAVWSKTFHPKVDKVRELRWNGTTSTGRAVSAGVYMVRVSTVNGGQTSQFIQKAVLDR